MVAAGSAFYLAFYLIIQTSQSKYKFYPLIKKKVPMKIENVANRWGKTGDTKHILNYFKTKFHVLPHFF